MFETHHDFTIQRGIDEAFACQDMLARAPVRASLLSRLRVRLEYAVRTLVRRGPKPRPAGSPAASLDLTR